MSFYQAMQLGAINLKPLIKETEDKKLKQKLSALFNKDVAVNYHLNPQILGGLIIRCGTVLIDSSVKHRLDSLEQLMKGTK